MAGESNNTKPYVDLAIIAPLVEEYKRISAKFPIIEERVAGKIVYSRVDLGVANLGGVLVLQDDMGKAAATRAAEFLLTQYELGAIAVVGIAGGLSNDVAVGDVCLSTNIIDVLENAAVRKGKGASLDIDLNSIFLGSNDRLGFAAKYLSIGHDLRGAFEDWQLRQHYDAQALIPDKFIGRQSKYEGIGLPSLHEGYIVCGAVSKSDIYKAKLSGLGRKILAIETESGGVFSSANAAGVPALAVRGICDYSDENKKKLEEETNGNLRRVAADNAVSLLAAQVANPQFLLFLANRRQALLPMPSGSLVPLTSNEDVRAKLQSEAHQQLTQSSPAYRGKPEGYRLPLPRVRPAASSATVHPSIQKTDPIDLLEAIATDRITVLESPRNYPDDSLPWIIAAELARIDLHGKPTAPLVIDGEQIKPPSGNVTNATNVKFSDLLHQDGWKKVFIISDFNANSQSRVAALKEDIDRFPAAHFVILQKHESSVSGESRLVTVTGASRHHVTSVSFVEIATFIQRNFRLADQEASVVAYRLHMLFQRFELNAHPSYFAGVPGDLLSSLLKANRRSELIQLAVSGFLSFVVASDTDDVVLSRTTREAFLRELAFEMNVNLRQFDRTELIAFISDFSERKDYPIDPFKFVDAFQSKGIIDFSDGKVGITLPFIESYLLASELVFRPKSAKQYFDPSSDVFDFYSFEIYAELGADKAVTQNIVAALCNQAAELRNGRNESHILLTNELRPRYVDRKGQIDAVKERLVAAVEDVTHNRDNSRHKQRLLDLATRVNSEARADKEIVSSKSRTTPEEDRKTRDGFRVWAIATTLLGSGSERLDKEPKRQLVAEIVTTTTILLDRILREFPAANFEHLRKRMRADDVLREIFDLRPDEVIPDELREFAETLVDSYEFSLLTYPMRLMFEHIGEAAGQKVLRSSLESVQPTDEIDNLVIRLWGAEIDAVKGKASLMDAVRKLPPFAFLRLALSNHLLSRVFWNHWDSGNRMALLDAVSEVLKPLGSEMDKGRLKRELEKETQPKKESDVAL